MYDPFPAAPQLLVRSTQPLADALHLQTLSLHIHEIVFFALLYQVAYAYFSPWISTQLFPKRYLGFPERTRLNWDVHVVSLIQSLLITSFAFYTIVYDSDRWHQSWFYTRHHDPLASQLQPAQARVMGYTPLSAHIISMAVGYFLWDLMICTKHLDIFGIGLLLHAISALTVYVLGFTPFVNYYAASFILYECSSPALNIHWFLDKTGQTGSKWQWYNGAVLLASFAGSRLIWGTYAGFRVFWDIWQCMNHPVNLSDHQQRWLNNTIHTSKELSFAPQLRLPEDPMRFVTNGATPSPWMGGVYLTSMIVLSILNFYWFFGRMIGTLRKRFEEAPEGKSEQVSRTTALQEDNALKRRKLGTQRT